MALIPKISTKNLESPFRWGIEKSLVKRFNESQEIPISVDEEPVLALMNQIMITYCRAIEEKYDGALESMIKTTKIWNQILDSQLKIEGLAMNVLKHILNATEYDLFIKLKNQIRATKVILCITDSKSFQTETELGTIEGCKSIAYSTFHESGSKKAASFAKKAVLYRPDCALWHFILGKNLRRERRTLNGRVVPSAEERDAILKSYELLDIPLYAVSAAQMYKENRDQHKSKEIYQKLFSQKPLSININLRLARTFTQSNEFEKAKVCFDYVEKRSPNNSMFLHYKGLYYKKQNNFEEAVKFFEAAAKCNSFKADLEYSRTMMQKDKTFDCIEHLKSLEQKYGWSIVMKQQLILHIAMQYLLDQKDIENALVHFLKAIQLGAENKQLEEFWCSSQLSWKPYNIFGIVNKLLGRVEPTPEIISEMRKTSRALHNYSDECNLRKEDVVKLSESLKMIKL